MPIFKNNTTKESEIDYIDNEQTIRIDLADDDDYYYIYAEIPGRPVNDIKMKFKGDRLSIRLVEESEDENPIENKSCIICERIHDEVERLISFDEPIDKKKTTAKLENGVLFVTIKKVNPDSDSEEDLIVIT